METSIYLAFVLATTIMIALPGPSVLLTVANSISFGWKRGVMTFLLITFSVTSVWALLAGKFSELLKSRRASANISRASGILMILAGIGLSLARKGRS